MFKLILCMGLHYAAGAAPASFVLSDYNREADVWLHLFTKPATWLDANNHCQLYGGHLASPKNNEIIQAMRAKMEAQEVTHLFTAIAFNTMNGLWMTGSCYKFHRQAKVWRWALNTCHTEGGHLAIINSDVEHTVLFNLFLQNPPPTHIGSRDNQYAYVGFRKWTGTDWASIYGDPLGSLGFERWAQNEPNNKDGLEDCGGIYSSNGLLNDMQCWVPSAFICEITP